MKIVFEFMFQKSLKQARYLLRSDSDLFTPSTPRLRVVYTLRQPMVKAEPISIAKRGDAICEK